MKIRVEPTDPTLCELRTVSKSSPFLCKGDVCLRPTNKGLVGVEDLWHDCSPEGFFTAFRLRDGALLSVHQDEMVEILAENATFYRIE